MPQITIMREGFGGVGFLSSTYLVDVPSWKITVAQLTEILEKHTPAGKAFPANLPPILAKDQKLVYNTKLMTMDGGKKTLEQFKCHEEAEQGNDVVVTMMNMNVDEDAGFGAMPEQFARMQHMFLGTTEGADTMQKMMGCPVMMDFRNDPNLLKTVLMMSPAWRALVDRNPELGQLLFDEDVKKEANLAFNNPHMMRSLLQSTERAMKDIESMPGGLGTVRQMNNKIFPKMNEFGKTCKKSSEEAAKSEHPADVAAPKWDPNNFDPSAMASMMQDANMCQLMAALAAGNASKKKGKSRDEAKKRAASDPFAQPAFLQQMFSPNVMEAMAHMQQAMKNLNSEDETKAAKQAPAESSGDQKSQKEVDPEHIDLDELLNFTVDDTSPVKKDFAQAFDNFIQAQKLNPAIRWKTQLIALKNMGFTDSQMNTAALQEAWKNKSTYAMEGQVTQVNSGVLGTTEGSRGGKAGTIMQMAIDLLMTDERFMS